MKESKLQNFFERYLTFAEKHPLRIILLALILAGLSWFPISKIRLDADLDDLLPQNTPTINAMKESNQRYGSADLFTIAIQHDDPQVIASVQDEIKAGIEKWEDAVYVQVARSNEFFMKHALMYLPVHHLERIVDNLVDVKLELGTHTPMVVDFDDDVEEEVKGERVWFDATIAQELGLPDEAASAFEKFLKPKAKKGEKQVEEWKPKKNLPDSLKDRLIGAHRDGTMNGVVQAALNKPSSDTKYVKTVLDRTEKILEPIRKKYGSAIDVGVEGSYKGLQEVESLATNGIIATVISVGLVFLIIVTYFQSFGAFVAIFSQIIMSCLYTAAFTYIVYGRLNMYTAFVFAIILGMGIDYSIHIMGHAQKDARKGMPWKEALTSSLTNLLHPIVLAAITTIAGLLTLLTAEFVGFYEFGVIASAGIVFSVLTAVFLLPALIFLLQKFHKVPLLGAVVSLPDKPARSLIPAGLKIKDWQGALKKTSIVVIIGLVVLIFFIPKTDFEHDFKNLRDTTPKNRESNRHVGVAIQSNRKSSQPIVAMANSPETMVQLHDTLLHRLTVEKDTLLRSFLTLTTFVPPGDKQEERLEIIEEISDEIAARVFDRSTGDDSIMIGKLRDMTEVEEFTAQDIPPWALRLVLERDNTYGKIAFIYGSYRSSNALEAAKFQDRYGHFTLNGEKLKLYSSSFIYADIIRLVKKDSRKMGWLIALIITFTLALTLRSFKLLLISLLGLFGGVLWTIGAMGLLDVKLGPFNLIVVPTILGVSVDSVIHLTLAYRRYGLEKLGELFSVTGSLVTASVVTTLAGYAGMLFTTHQGIGTIGALAIVGFTSCLIVSITLTPWACTKFNLKKK